MNNITCLFILFLLRKINFYGSVNTLYSELIDYLDYYQLWLLLLGSILFGLDSYNQENEYSTVCIYLFLFLFPILLDHMFTHPFRQMYINLQYAIILFHSCILQFFQYNSLQLIIFLYLSCPKNTFLVLISRIIRMEILILIFAIKFI